MPPGITPPLIIRYNASSVPILQIGAQQRDAVRAAALRLRPELHPHAARAPCRARRCRCPTAARRGRSWSISTRDALYANGLSPQRRVSDAINAQNLILPAGTAKIGRHASTTSAQQQPRRRSTRSTTSRSRRSNGATVYMRDVAHVRDGYAVADQHRPHATADARRLLTILKNGNASTLDIVERVKRGAAAASRRRCRRSSKIELLFDQSLFVRAAIDGVVTRGGDRGRPDGADDPAVPRQLAQHADRRDLDPAVDPDLDHRAAALLGQTLNVMTLGGLALAVGILVDDATVEIENIHRNLGHGEAARAGDPRRRAADRGAGVRLDAGICIVFVPVVFLDGAGRSTCSRRWRWRWSSRCWPRYLLSRTLVPTMVHYLLAGASSTARARAARGDRGLVRPRLHAAFERRLRAAARRATRRCSRGRSTHRLVVAVGVRSASSRGSLLLVPVRRPGLLPDGRRRPVPAARARARRHAHRGDRALLRPGRRTRSARSFPTDEIEHDPRQHRPADAGIQPGLRRQRARSARPTARSWSR